VRIPSEGELKAEDVRVGQVWERRDGSRVTIDYIERGYARYWLATGSRPQYRDVRIDILLKRWKLVPAAL
jgi:hypothetical protein